MDLGRLGRVAVLPAMEGGEAAVLAAVIPALGCLLNVLPHRF